MTSASGWTRPDGTEFWQLPGEAPTLLSIVTDSSCRVGSVGAGDDGHEGWNPINACQDRLRGDDGPKPLFKAPRHFFKVLSDLR